MQSDLRGNTVKWMAGIIGELQETVRRRDAENSELRKQIRNLKREVNRYKPLARLHQKTLSAKAAGV